MLAGSEKFRCIICGERYGSDRFAYHKGLFENGPAYWCDHGLLCSPECSIVHDKARAAQNTTPGKPAPNPLDSVSATPDRR